MIVAGVMSGTSADGINVALVRFASSTKDGPEARHHTRTHIQTSRFSLMRSIRSLLRFDAQSWER